jgi:hypothetical protein
MSFLLKSSSFTSWEKESWLQAYSKDNIGLILQADDKDKGLKILDKLVDSLKDLKKASLRELQESFKKIESISLGVLIIIGGKGYFFCRNATVLLGRNGKLSVLIDKSGVAKGNLQDNDKIILINQGGISAFGLNKLTSLASENLSTERICENLLIDLHKNGSSFSVVGLVLQVRSKQSEQKAKQVKKRELKSKIAKTIIRIISFVLRLPKITWAALGILAIVFFVFAHFNGHKIDTGQFSEKFELARHKYDEGKALVELNKLRARDVLVESETELEELLATLKEGQEEYKKAQKLLKEIEDVLQVARAAYKVKPKLFFDLSLIRDNLTADIMEGAKGKVYILSRQKKNLSVINLETKASEVIAGGSWLKETKYLAVSSNKQFVLLSDGINEVGKERQVIIEYDKDWKGVVDLEYFGGSLYLLDGEGEILKYVPTEDGFSKRSFFKGDYRLNSPSSFAIDGNIWVLDNGLILKFVGGRRDNFVVRGLEKSFGKGAKIYKTKDLNNLYILDRVNNRVVVVREEGQFQAEYSWEKMGEVSSIVVSEEKGKIYLLRKDKIYTIDLQ